MSNETNKDTPAPVTHLMGLSEATAGRVLKLLDVYAPDVFNLEMAATIASAARPAHDNLIRAAVEEYLLLHAAEGEDQRLGRHSAIRGLMVRLRIYTEFCAALNEAPSPQPRADE